MEQETFWTLMHNAAHWQFELFVGFLETLVIDGIVLGVFWPRIQRHLKHHFDRDKREGLK